MSQAADAGLEAGLSERPARPSYGFARRNGATLIEWLPDAARIAHRQDVDVAILSELRRYLRAPLKLEPMGDEAYEALIQSLYQHGSDDAQQMVADFGGQLDLTEVAEALPEPKDLLESEDDAPIIRLINALLTEAVNEGASDIHIEPFEDRLMVRFRVDGVLREILAPPRSIAPLVVSRIKVMAHLDIAEKRLPQDGRISLRVAGRPVDVRVSTIPAGHGERVVLRLLDKQAGRLTLDQLGMVEGTNEGIDRLIRRPHGILLVTGPTGSGKTTTLYAALQGINDRSRNIMTVEDPIEYYIDGIGQTQVNTKVDMSFARGLRAILRQDPDVVMVGEIRDIETASIAVQASLTGHLVMSTLHTNSAVGAITRMRDMGVESFLLSSSLIGVLAQRLVRTLCPECREQVEATPTELQAFNRPVLDNTQIYRARGCEACRGTGYRGRTGIYEMVIVDEDMRQLIHDGAGEQSLTECARQRTQSILDDGWEKMVAGITTSEEVLRVTREE